MSEIHGILQEQFLFGFSICLTSHLANICQRVRAKAAAKEKQSRPLMGWIAFLEYRRCDVPLLYDSQEPRRTNN